MKAMLTDQEHNLVWSDVEEPQVKADSVLIEVHAAAVSALLSGNLGYDPNVHCDHHDHEHGEAGHTCGDHGCGKHSCH